MSRSQTPFHIQQGARPQHVERILVTAPTDHPLRAEGLQRHLAGQGYTITPDATRRSLDMGAKLGIFKKGKDNEYQLTDRGVACRRLAQYRPEVYHDIMHFVLFATWEFNAHRDHWSWSYSTVCKHLWQDSPTLKDRKSLFGQLYADASREFPELDPVVGTETVGMVTTWLRELSPPFFIMENERITGSRRREWFSPELALLAVSYFYRVRGIAEETPLLLDGGCIEQLSPLCLANPDCVIGMIDTAARTFPALSIHIGEWGSSVLLRQRVDISLLA